MDIAETKPAETTACFSFHVISEIQPYVDPILFRVRVNDASHSVSLRLYNKKLAPVKLEGDPPKIWCGYPCYSVGGPPFDGRTPYFGGRLHGARRADSWSALNTCPGGSSGSPGSMSRLALNAGKRIIGIRRLQKKVLHLQNYPRE